MAALSSILAWKIPWTEEPGSLPFFRLSRVRQYFANEPPPHTQTHKHINKIHTNNSNAEKVRFVLVTEWVL